MTYFGRYSFIFLFILFSSQGSAENVSNKLSEVLTQIKNVKLLLSKHQTQQAGLQKDLQRTELAINNISIQLQKTATNLNEKRQSMHQLTEKQNVIEQRIKKRQRLLLKQIQSIYMVGMNKNKYQFLLQGQDPEKISRWLMYNRYLSSQNNELINNLKNDLITLKNNKQEILTHVNYLATLKQKQISQQKELDYNKHSQQGLLQNLSLQVKSHTEELKDLLKNKKNLENVVERLQKKESYASDYLTHHKGHFPWPTSGKIIEHFGSAIQNSELKQNGVLIGAPEGQKVYAVAPGRVIFANWMPGYGLLLIIDHGKDYMTLYGNNGVLYKKTHELVTNHELIATVGHTGGQQKSGLYFALRCKGKPVDPGSWCG